MDLEELTPEVAEKLRDLAHGAKTEVILRDLEEIDQKPPVKLYEWTEIDVRSAPLPFGHRVHFCVARRVENHPRLGSFTAKPGEHIITGNLVYINKEIGIARTKRTTYLLIGPEAVWGM